jgi:uncharacterized protein YndB with AHSA1/START domain
MPATVEEQTVSAFEIIEEESIDAPIDIVFQAVLDELGPEGAMHDGKSLSLKLEAWPGGRWFRDLGNNIGHLWGHVQVIKPPTLLEISGPLPMSYPAVNHIQYRLSSSGNGTKLKFTHKAMGLIVPEHRDGMPEGWGIMLRHIREVAEKRRQAAPGKR